MAYGGPVLTLAIEIGESYPLTHAKMAALLLRGAADFYRTMKTVSPSIARELEINAQSCEQVADRVETDPESEAPHLDDEDRADPAP